MKITVCIKQVPDVNAPIQIKEGELIQDSNRNILNAYDASAVEAALVLKETAGIDEIEVLLIGPEKATESIRKALAMGADKGTHIVNDEGSTFDSFTYAKILALHLGNTEYDYIFCGKQSQDTDSGLTGSMLAELLDLPYTTNAVGLEMSNSTLTVKRQGDAGQEVIEIPSPGLITCSNDMNDPRIPNLKGIMQSKRKPVETIPLSDISLDLSEDSIKTNILSYEDKPERKAGEKYDGEPEEIARKVARLLDQEANVI